MLALAGYPMGLQFRVLDPGVDPPAGEMAPAVTAQFDDLMALDAFMDGCDVVTFEFEQVPADSARHIARHVPVHPSPDILEVAQDRLAEKDLFASLDIPTARFARVDDHRMLTDAVATIGGPSILKTRGGGYDGKGQVRIATESDTVHAWEDLGAAPCILEEVVDFERELSIIAARTEGGDIAFYPPVENHHRDGLLRLSIAPAPDLTQDLVDQAEHHARAILERYDYQGILAIELFEKNGVLFGNEFAPRVHNSGHWTIEGAETSQFENHLRGVLGLPLGDPSARGYAAMVNLIGTLPDTTEVLAAGGHLHLYGKEPRPGRKLGHITVRADSAADLAVAIERISALIDQGRS